MTTIKVLDYKTGMLILLSKIYELSKNAKDVKLQELPKLENSFEFHGDTYIIEQSLFLRIADDLSAKAIINVTKSQTNTGKPIEEFTAKHIGNALVYEQAKNQEAICVINLETPDPAKIKSEIEKVKLLKAEEKQKSADDTEKLSEIKNTSEENRYEFKEYEKIPSGILKFGTTEITFKKLRARILHFFYSSSKNGNSHRNYKDFNIFNVGDETVTSDEFNKEIKSINTRVEKETRGLVREAISKGENKKNEANIYKWNKIT